MTSIATSSPILLFDWASLAWILLIGVLTFATLTIKARFDQVAAMGRFAQILANVVIGYFGIGMAAFGLWSVLRGSFPVPGGAAWEGSLGIVGGLAAALIGSCTLGEHLLHQRAARRAATGEALPAS